MIRPMLVCQGFQRAFVDVAGGMFSMSASVRRSTCEQILRHARISKWAVVHTFLDTEALDGIGAASIDTFAPGPIEPYFRQRTLSAFGAPGFCAKLEELSPSPIFLISLSGLGAVAATFLDGLERRFPIYVVIDGVADIASSEVGERERLVAMETIARAHGRSATCADLFSITYPRSSFTAVANRGAVDG